MENSSIKGGTELLTFTFVPETGRLPSQVLLEKDSTFLPKIVVDHKIIPQKPEKISEKKLLGSSGKMLNTCQEQRSEDIFSKKKLATIVPEEKKYDDLFIAEFVVVMDSDDSEEEKITTKTPILLFEETEVNQSSVVQPEAMLEEANNAKMYAIETPQEFCYDAEDQELKKYCPVPTVDLDSNKLFSNLSDNKIGYKVPLSLHEKQISDKEHFEDIPIASQKSNLFNNITTKSSSHAVIKSLNCPNKLESQSKCIRSKSLSPLPLQVIKYPLCRSPSPLNSPYYGSTSTICSMNICTSPVPRPDSVSPVSSRLSFLTSLLKSKNSNTDRVVSPIPYQPKSMSQSFHKSALSNVPQKSISCFSLNLLREHKMTQFEKKGNILPSVSDSNISHAESLHLKPLRTPSPDSIHSKSSSGTLHCRRGVVSPYAQLYRRSITPPVSAEENTPLLNDKPPLSKHIYSPFKKDCVLGKSRKVTLFQPPLHFNQPFNKQKENVLPYLKRGNLKSSISSDSKNHHNKSSCSSKTQDRGFPQPYSDILYYQNVDSEMDISPPLNPGYSCQSYCNEELSRKYTSLDPLPSNYLAPSRSILSRSCELHTSPLSQSSNYENKKLYNIKSSYKTFAAIPTNTLLLDQKAIDISERNTNSAGADEMETHSEMCSPALLRQQTEEICAAIDEHCNSASRSSKKKCDSKSGIAPKPLSKPAGRETKYASLQPPFMTNTKDFQTKPGVIRPETLKVHTTEKSGQRFYSQSLQQLSMPPYKREMDFGEGTRCK